MKKLNEVTMISGGRRVNVSIFSLGNRFYLQMPYNKPLQKDIKSSMSKPKWHGFDKPPLKMWSVEADHRTNFVIRFLTGEPVYERFDEPLPEIETPYPLFEHQRVAVSHILTRRTSILALEMGLGKSLSAIVAGEEIKKIYPDDEMWYIGPVSGVEAFSRELVKWKTKLQFRMYTYDRLVKVLVDWKGGRPPRYLILDESSKVKTPTTKRTQAAQYLGDCMRDCYGDDCYIVEMTGTPSPLAPTDWYSQTEIARPGYLYENSIHAFRERLAILTEGESATGGIFKQIAAWRDGSDVCNVCGRPRESGVHGVDHGFVPAPNEVYDLYERLRGLVLVRFKRDCLDLPEKEYIELIIKPTVDMLRAAQTIKSTATSAITALAYLRELADGFQYRMADMGRVSKCSICSGVGYLTVPELHECGQCNGTGSEIVLDRTQEFVGSPKFAALMDIADEHEDVGRLIVWGGFQATLDNIKTAFLKADWEVLMVDARGYRGFSKYGELDAKELLSAMDRSHPDRKALAIKYPKLVFVGHPQAGGMALTLTAAPTAVYFSNAFDGGARVQSEDRFHRIGMDENRACKIIDMICLPTDKVVLENLKKKRRLQDLTLGELNEYTNDPESVRHIR